MHELLSFCVGPYAIETFMLPSVSGDIWFPVIDPAGGFFLLKGSFSLPLSPKCLMKGVYFFVGFFICITVWS